MANSVSYKEAIIQQGEDTNSILDQCEGLNAGVFNNNAKAAADRNDFELTATAVNAFLTANPIKFPATMTSQERKAALKEAQAADDVLGGISNKLTNFRIQMAKENQTADTLGKGQSPKIQALAAEIKQENTNLLGPINLELKDINRIRLKAQAVISTLESLNKPVPSTSFSVKGVVSVLSAAVAVGMAFAYKMYS